MKKGIIFVTLSALIYGFTPILCKICFINGSNSITITLMRNIISLLISLFLIVLKKENFYISKDKVKAIIISSTFGCFLSPLLLYSSYSFINVGQATILHFVYPFITVFVYVVAFKNKINKGKKYSIYLAILSLLIFIDFKDICNIYGVLISVASGICYSIYLIFIERKQLDQMKSIKLTYYLSLVSTIEIIFYNSFNNKVNLWLPFNVILIIILISFLSSFIAVILLQKGIKQLGCSISSVICLLEPLSSLIFGVIFLKEILTIRAVTGSILLFISLILFLLNSNKRNCEITN